MMFWIEEVKGVAWKGNSERLPYSKNIYSVALEKVTKSETGDVF